MTSAFALLAAMFIGACTSGKNPDGRGTSALQMGVEPEGVWEKSQASPHAYDTFTFNKMQPIGAKNEFMFYYKTCADVGAKAWYSKTSYECTVP